MIPRTDERVKPQAARIAKVLRDDPVAVEIQIAALLDVAGYLGAKAEAGLSLEDLKQALHSAYFGALGKPRPFMYGNIEKPAGKA